MYKFINRFFYYIILIFFPLAFISSCHFFINRYTSYILVSVLVILISILIAMFYLKKNDKDNYLINERQFLITIIFMAMAIRILEILIVQTPPTSDFLTMYNGALKLLNGEFGIGLSKRAYWYRWNYQIGFTFYEFLVLKVFHTKSMMILKLFNVVWITGTIFLSYKIARKIFGQSTARISAIFITLYLPNILSASVLTNQHIATFFVLLAVHSLLNNEGKFKYFMVGIFVGLGHLMRPLAPVYMTAITIYIVVNAIYNNYKLKKTFLNLIKTIGMYMVIIYLASFLFISLGMTDRVLTDQALPTWKFLVGTDYESNGHIGNYERELMNKLYHEWDVVDYDKFNEVAKKEIVKRIKDDFPIKYFKLLGSKFYEYWGTPDSIVNWSILRSADTEELFYYYLYGRHLIAIGLFQIIVVYMFAGIGVFREILNKKYNHKNLLLIISVLGYIGAHLLAEIQTRYRYSIMPILFILCAYGIVTIIDLIKKVSVEKCKQMQNYKIIKVLILILIIVCISIFRFSNTIKIKNINVNKINGKYIFSINTSYSNKNLLYAWYIYKDSKIYEKIPYSKENTLIKELIEDGEYKIKGYVKSEDGEGTSKISRPFKVELRKSKGSIQIINLGKLQLQRNKFLFFVKTLPQNEELSYAWYIYKDGNIYEKVKYSNECILTKSFEEKGNYKIKYFVKNNKREGKSGYFDEITIQ